MRRAVPILLLITLVTTASAQTRPRAAPGAAPDRGGPPHAWLFGVWTGGLFPVLDGMLAQDCRTQPTVVFAQDTVGHTTLFGGNMVQRVIETVRTSPTGAEFRFTPAAQSDPGFGCDDPNVLHVARSSGTTIAFPLCKAFPYPLERCGGR
jgi:hypothetical protein